MLRAIAHTERDMIAGHDRRKQVGRSGADDNLGEPHSTHAVHRFVGQVKLSPLCGNPSSDLPCSARTRQPVSKVFLTRAAKKMQCRLRDSEYEQG